METKEGIIQRIKQDRKALAIENEWFNSFKPLDESIQVGQEIKLTFQTKGKFRNIRNIEPIKETNEIESNLSATDKNCLLIVAKDLAIEFKDKSLTEWLRIVTKLREDL